MTIYLDLDGVIADFEGRYLEVFGHLHNSVSDDKMWENINSYPDFWSGIKPLPHAKEFYDTLLLYDDVIILTACPKSDYKNVALHKKEWVKKHICPDVMVLPVMGGKNKALFMHREGDILIDDFGRNIKEWIKLGGVGIRHKSVKQSLTELDNHINPYKEI